MKKWQLKDPMLDSLRTSVSVRCNFLSHFAVVEGKGAEKCQAGVRVWHGEASGQKLTRT